MTEAGQGRTSDTSHNGGRVRIFIDDELDAKFARDGFVVVRLIDAERARAIDAESRTLLPADIPAHENVTYIYGGEPELKWIDRLAGTVMDEALVPLLDDMRRLHSSVIIKPAGERAVPPHVHPIFTLEQTASTVFCWCALKDMDENNGAMQVLPGSHKLFPIMPMYGQEPYFLSAMPLVKDRMQTLYLKAGEALLFDESLIHGSLPNPGGQDRLALATHCVKNDFEAIALFRVGNGQYQVCTTGQDFGYQYHIRKEELDPTDRWPTLGFVDDVHRPVGAEEFFERLDAGKRIALTYPLVPRRKVPAPKVGDKPSVFSRALTSLRARIRAYA